jgi:hypothetical protein
VAGGEVRPPTYGVVVGRPGARARQLCGAHPRVYHGLRFPYPPPSGIDGGPRSTVIAAWGLSSGCHGLWAGEKDDSVGDLPGYATSSAPTKNLYVNSCYLLPFAEKLAVVANTGKSGSFPSNSRALYLFNYCTKPCMYIVEIDRLFEG